MKTKVKSDEQGIYVRVDGYIARPSQATTLTDGNPVQASHPPGPIARVRLEGTPIQAAEVWSIHECYWWHKKEGKGAHAKQLRALDRERNPSLYQPGNPHTMRFVANFPENG